MERKLTKSMEIMETFEECDKQCEESESVDDFIFWIKTQNLKSVECNGDYLKLKKLILKHSKQKLNQFTR